MEPRRLLSTTTLLVTSPGDEGTGTFREAIEQANAATGPVSITFAIPGTGVQTIPLASNLPAITNTVSIDGSSQGGPGYQGPPRIELSGPGESGTPVVTPGPATIGLDFEPGSDGSTVRGLAIDGFSTAGIVIAAHSVTVAGNTIGTDPSRPQAMGNGVGIDVRASASLLGGTTDADRNVIEGNTGSGVAIDDGFPATASTSAGGLTLSAAAAAAGFRLATFASGFPTAAGNTGNGVVGAVGPLGIAFLGSRVMVTTAPGQIYLFPTGTDGQTAQASLVTATYPYNALGLAQVGDSVYLGQAFGPLVEINPDGSFRRDVFDPGPGGPAGMALDPTNGHLLVSVPQQNKVFDVDPLTGAATAVATGVFDGLTTDGTILYGVLYNQSRIVGIRLSDGSQVFDSGTLAGDVDGLALGTGTLAGNLFVNTNAGLVYEVNLTTGAATTLATGGSRGDFATVDPYTGTLLLTQSDLIARLVPPLGGGFYSPEPHLGDVVQGNAIARNGGTGVEVLSGTGKAILANAITANGRLGIDLGGDGVTPNDPGDPDVGPNRLQNFPVLTSVISTGSSTTIQGTLDSTPNTTFHLEFFANDAADPSGFGQGQVFLDAATTTVTTDAGGLASFSRTIPQGLATSQFVTATATDPEGSTSEFSAAAAVKPPPPPAKVQFGAPTYSVDQDSGRAVIDVTQAGGAAAVHVTYATVAGGTAIPGIDYVPASGTLDFGAGQTSLTFPITLLPNLLLGGNKTIDLSLSQPAGGILGPQSMAVLTLINHNTLIVTSPNDSGPGTLHQAILTADFNPGPNTITFALPGPGPFVISPATALPPITDPVTIDATSQAGYQGTPIVILDGIRTQNGPEANGLDVNAGPSVIRGLEIIRFSGSGIFVDKSGGSVIEGNLIGTNAAGDWGLGNLVDGIVLNESSGNRIGGASNVIADNGQVGLRIMGASASGNFVAGNLIGTDPSGTRELGNHKDGLFVDGAPNNTIGSGEPGGRNVISGNVVVGVQIGGAGATGNVVQGNFLGTDKNGTAPLGNLLDGVFLDGAANNLIGGVDPTRGNVIAANGAVGVRISGSTATGNVVQDNLIGTDSGGAAALGNANDGVFTLNAPGNSLLGNVISANGEVGIQLYGTGSSGNTIQGNLIGTDRGGTASLGNALDGIFVNGAPNNTIGGPLAAARNVISANGSSGIQFYGPDTTGNLVQGNLIGTDINGAPNLGNAYGIFFNGAPNNTVVDSGPGQNTIAGNTKANIVRSSGGPVVTDVTPSESGGLIRSIVISFSTTLNPARAQKKANYQIQRLGGAGGRPGRVPIGVVLYDPSLRTVTLTLARAMPSGTQLRLRVSGSARSGLTDLAGNLLDGDANGTPGGDFTTILGAGPASAATRGGHRGHAHHHVAAIATHGRTATG
jgi:parallel beta-helix repeat protein